MYGAQQYFARGAWRRKEAANMCIDAARVNNFFWGFCFFYRSLTFEAEDSDFRLPITFPACRNKLRST